MNRQRTLACTAIAVAFATAGCHTMRFEFSDAPAARVVRKTKPFFLWGLAPTKNVDLAEHCPDGVVAIREQTTFPDGLVSLLTIGLVETRTSWYHCAAPGTFSQEAAQ